MNGRRERISIFLGEARSHGGRGICAPLFVELLADPSITQDVVEPFLKETGIVVDFGLDATVWRQTDTPITVLAAASP